MPSSSSNPSVPGDNTIVLTVWPDHDTFDAWIATPERDALTASAVHQAVDYRPITRYEIAGGYLNLAAIATGPDMFPTEEAQP